MNRLFGKSKPKEPGPSINDCITGVSIVDFDQLLIDIVGNPDLMQIKIVTVSLSVVLSGFLKRQSKHYYFDDPLYYLKYPSIDLVINKFNYNS